MRPGTLFLHARALDPAWKPGPGERYADAPHALCRVTATRAGRIYYRIGAEPGRAHGYFAAAAIGAHVERIIRP